MEEINEPLNNMRQHRFHEDSVYQEINHAEVSNIISNGRCSAPLYEDPKEKHVDSKSHSHRDDTRDKLELTQ
jgi:hypothetical protein